MLDTYKPQGFIKKRSHSEALRDRGEVRQQVRVENNDSGWSHRVIERDKFSDLFAINKGLINAI
jgi:hypothetical protein